MYLFWLCVGFYWTFTCYSLRSGDLAAQVLKLTKLGLSHLMAENLCYFHFNCWWVFACSRISFEGTLIVWFNNAMFFLIYRTLTLVLINLIMESGYDGLILFSTPWGVLRPPEGHKYSWSASSDLLCGVVSFKFIGPRKYSSCTKREKLYKIRKQIDCNEYLININFSDTIALIYTDVLLFIWWLGFQFLK